MKHDNKFTFKNGKYSGKTVYTVISDPNNEFFSSKNNYKEFLGEEIEFENKKFKIIGVEVLRPFIPQETTTLGFMVEEII